MFAYPKLFIRYGSNTCWIHTITVKYKLDNKNVKLMLKVQIQLSFIYTVSQKSCHYGSLLNVLTFNIILSADYSKCRYITIINDSNTTHTFHASALFVLNCCQCVHNNSICNQNLWLHSVSCNVCYSVHIAIHPADLCCGKKYQIDDVIHCLCKLSVYCC